MHAALCSVVGNVSMSVNDWARGWTGLGATSEVGMPTVDRHEAMAKALCVRSTA